MADIFLHLNGEQKGPFPPDKVRAMLGAGEITPDTLAWHEGLREWSKVSVILGPPGVPGLPQPPMPPLPAKKGLSGWLIALIVIGGVLVLSIPCCCGIAIGPITSGIKMAKENAAVQKARVIGLAMFSYANDHDGNYPDGKTSTEVFQKLLDGKYVTDPTIFYLDMPGKTKPSSSTLTADNVSFDVTSGVSSTTPDSIPVVFCTGYTVSYAPGATATRDSPTATPFPGPGKKFSGVAVYFKSNNARFLYADPDGSIPSFIPPEFDAGGKTYVQLRP
jgi:hypothetical protein